MDVSMVHIQKYSYKSYMTSPSWPANDPYRDFMDTYRRLSIAAAVDNILWDPGFPPPLDSAIHMAISRLIGMDSPWTSR